MTTPADDCGVSGGCGACPLFAANVCGDPGPTPAAAPASDWRGLAAYVAAGYLTVPVDPDAPDVDPAEPKPEGAGCCGGGCGG